MPEEVMEEQTGETGEYAGASEFVSAPADGLASVLVILTSIFLLISIAMVTIRLYSAYDIGKNPQDVKERERSIRSK